MFASPVDVANRALQLMGEPRITAFSDSKRGAVETGFAQDKVRRAELRRAVWTFSTRRMVLRSLTSTSVRLVFPTYSSSTTYAAGDVVRDSTGFPWIATAASTGVDPTTDYGVYPSWIAYFGQLYADTWSGTPTYYPGDMVVQSGTVYLCVAQTTNNQPPNTTYWHAPQSVTTVAVQTISPAGYAPSPASTAQRKAFPLPANFMRLAPQDPKQPGTATLSVTAGMGWNDWELEAGFIYSATLASPVVLRFVADTADVTMMDDLFCEAWAASLGLALNEQITQNPDKAKEIEAAYTRVIGVARTIAAIEQGSTEDDVEQAGNPPTKPPSAGAQR